MSNKWRHPKPNELNTTEFNAVWNTIKNWNIGLPVDLTPKGGQLYRGATGNHVVAILDSLRKAGCITSR